MTSAFFPLSNLFWQIFISLSLFFNCSLFLFLHCSLLAILPLQKYQLPLWGLSAYLKTISKQNRISILFIAVITWAKAMCDVSIYNYLLCVLLLWTCPWDFAVARLLLFVLEVSAAAHGKGQSTSSAPSTDYWFFCTTRFNERPITLGLSFTHTRLNTYTHVLIL